MMRRLVIVGASLAGLRAAVGARAANFSGAITLIGAEKHLPYDRPPLSKAFLTSDVEPPPPTYPEARSLRDRLGVDLVLSAPATGLDTASHTVVVDSRPIRYDALVIATGADARRMGSFQHLAGVHPLRTLDDARAIRRALDAGARTVIIGAGFVGSEVASSARQRGLDVTVLEALPAPLVRPVGAAMGSACSSLHGANGTVLRCGVTVTGVEGNGRVERVRLSDGSAVAADLVVVGAGAVPATSWLAGSGLELRDGVLCDETLATNIPGIYAAGDVARWRNPLFDRDMRLEHRTSAAEQGTLAARNAVDPDRAVPYATIPYFWSDQYDTRIQFVGVPESEQVEVFGDVDGHRFIALYRDGDRLVGALTVGQRAVIMKYRALIKRRASWAEALELAARRPALAGSAHRPGRGPATRELRS